MYNKGGGPWTRGRWTIDDKCGPSEYGVIPEGTRKTVPVEENIQEIVVPGRRETS